LWARRARLRHHSGPRTTRLRPVRNARGHRAVRAASCPCCSGR
jgi:hypothetical protein